MQCDSMCWARPVNEANMNHGTFEHFEKLTAISLEETELILSLIRKRGCYPISDRIY